MARSPRRGFATARWSLPSVLGALRLPPTSAATERVTTAASAQPTINGRRIERRIPCRARRRIDAAARPPPPAGRSAQRRHRPAFGERRPSVGVRGRRRSPGWIGEASATGAAVASGGAPAASGGTPTASPGSDRGSAGGSGRCTTWCMSAECSPQKSDGLGASWNALGASAESRARGPNGIRSSRGPSQSRGRRTTLLSDGVPFPTSSISWPSLSNLHRPSAAVFDDDVLRGR